MKKIFFLILIFIPLYAVTQTSRVTVKNIETMHKQLPVFKYHYEIDTVTTFTILAYWENVGTAYTFSYNQLVEISQFDDYTEFVKFLIPSSKKLYKYILINDVVDADLLN